MGECKFIASYNNVFSAEKRNAVYIALGGIYNCSICKAQHKLEYTEAVINGKDEIA